MYLHGSVFSSNTWPMYVIGLHHAPSITYQFNSLFCLLMNMFSLTTYVCMYVCTQSIMFSMVIIIESVNHSYMWYYIVLCSIIIVSW